MFDSVNLKNVWQSVMDFWLPTFGCKRKKINV